MKKSSLQFLSLIILVTVLNSCATIVGGSKYTANVVVPNHPDASISYNGVKQGFGVVSISIPRVKANNVSFLIEEVGCEPQTIVYSGRALRGWAIAGTVIFWTGLPPALPIPWGLLLDVPTGAIYKPDIKEAGITKNDYKSFNYSLNYSGCESNKPLENSLEEKLIVLKNLFLEGLISAEEYEREKKKILDSM